MSSKSFLHQLGDFSILPWDVLLHILRSTKSFRDVVKLAFLSKAWREFIFSELSTIVPVLDFSQTRNVTNQFLQQKIITPLVGKSATKSSKVKKQKSEKNDISSNYAPQGINVAGASKITLSVLRQLIPNASNLTSVNLAGCYSIKFDAKACEDFGKLFEHLVYLNVCVARIEEPSALFGGMKQLKELVMEHSDMKAVLAPLKSLEVLSAMFKISELKECASAGCAPRLRVLSLAHLSGNASGSEILSILSHWTSLEVVFLRTTKSSTELEFDQQPPFKLVSNFRPDITNLKKLLSFGFDVNSLIAQGNDHPEKTLIAEAIQNVESLKFLLQRGASPKFTGTATGPNDRHHKRYRHAYQQNLQALSPILLAVNKSCPYEVYQMLCEYGADMDEPHDVSEIVKNVQDVRVLRLMLDHGAEVNTIVGGSPLGSGVTTLLVEAVRKQKIDMVKELVNRGAELDVSYGAPLRGAFTSNNVEIAEVLLQAGASLYIPDVPRVKEVDMCTTPLYDGICASKEVQALILSHKPNFLKPVEGCSLLAMAAAFDACGAIRFLLEQNTAEDSFRAVALEILDAKDSSSLPKGIESEWARNQNWTANDALSIKERELLAVSPVPSLIFALLFEEKKAFKLPDLSSTFPNGCTILHKCIVHANTTALAVLFEKSTVDINRQDNNGDTAALFLVKNKAGFRNIRYRGHYEDRPTFRSSDMYKLEYLAKRGADFTVLNNDHENLLHPACRHKDLPLVRFLLRHKWCDVNVVNSRGASPLVLAIQNMDMKMIEVLLQHGAKVNLLIEGEKKGTKSTGVTVLHTISRIINEDNCELPFWKDIVELLCKHGAEVNVENSNGEIPLHLFAKKGATQGILALIYAGSDVSLMDNEGNYPLSFLSQDVMNTFEKKVDRLPATYADTLQSALELHKKSQISNKRKAANQVGSKPKNSKR